jgi:hypothetical protein
VAATVRSAVMAAVFNLNHHASYVHWHFIDLSVSNLIVIILMLVVFVVAILAPFPGHKTRGAS